MQPLPPIPRRATWRRSLAQRWWLGAVGLLLVGGGAMANVLLSLAPDTHDRILSLGILPGVAAVLFWLRAVMRLRVLLTSGTATPAVVTEHTGEVVSYLYHDERGVEHNGQTEADGDTPLGQVIFDVDNPSFHVLARAADFVPNTTP